MQTRPLLLFFFEDILFFRENIAPAVQASFVSISYAVQLAMHPLLHVDCWIEAAS